MLLKKLLFLLFLAGVAVSSSALEVKITAAGGYQADVRWLAAATGMGHTASIVPVSTLDNTAFFATTDILIVSTGMNPITPTQIATIQSFLQSGKSVYLQGEYLPTQPGNIAFSQIVNAMGGSFTWGAALVNNLTPSVTGSLSSGSLAVPSLPYFWYGCTGTASCDVMAFLLSGNVPVGWMFQCPLPNTGRLIFTTDQDWIGASNVYASCLNLMKNVLSHLADKSFGDQAPTPLASITINSGNAICAGAPVNFTAQAVNAGLSPSYQWKKNGVNTGANSNSYNSALLQNNDTIRCIVTPGAGCPPVTAASNTIGVTVHIPDTVIQSFAVCASQLPYTWNGLSVTTAGNASITTSSLVTGCDSVTILQLTVNPVYVRDEDTSICFTQAPFTWASQSISSSGSYTHTFTSAAGCDSTVTLNLHIDAAPIAVNSSVAACVAVDFEGGHYSNNTIVKDTLYNARGCDSVYRTTAIQILKPVWDTIPGFICPGEVYAFEGDYPDREGSYVHRYTAGNGCDSFRVLILRVYESPDIRIIARKQEQLCVGDSLLLTGDGGQYYEWFYDDASLGIAAELHFRIPTFSSKIVLKGKDNNQCPDNDELSFQAEACCTLFMPNAFTPNGDGRNDQFGPVTNGHPEEFRMFIFNRWGQKIYTTSQLAAGWDGTVSGTPVDAGVYFYKVEGKCVSGSPLDKRGDLVLIR